MERGQIEIKDRKGNTTICPVNVYIDKNAPECELEVIGTMGENGWYGNEAPRVVFKSKTDSESGIESFGLGTSSKEYNFNREEEYIVTRGVTTVYGYVRDNAGNVGVCHTNSIKYDDVKPTITNVRYGYQVYPKEDIATVSGNTINLNYITSEYGTIYGAYIYFKGNVSGNSSISNGNTNLVNRTLSGVNKMEYTFNAGNYNNIKITVPNVNNVEKVELLTGLVNTSYYTNKDVTIYINSHDSYSGKAYYTFDGKTYQKDNYKVYPKNTSGIVVGVKDYAGNKGENQTTAITNIDKIAPNPCVLTKSGTVGVEEWYRSDVTISINGTDKPSTKDYIMSNIRDYDVTTGSKATNYRNPASGVQRTDTSSTYWNGFVKDKAGNTNTCKIEVKRDTVKPTCSVVTKGTYGDNQWYVTNVNISFSDKYDERSGLYKNGDITTSETSSNNGHTPVTHSTDTKGITYYGHVQDKAGNYGRCQIAFKRDTTLPTCTLKSAGTYKNWPWYTSNVTITLESTTDATSGIATSGLDTSSSNNFNKKTTQTQTKDTKGTTYYGHVKDNAGNMNTCNIVAHKDTKAPTCKVNFTNSGVSCTGSDVTSGPASCVTDKTAVSVGNYKGTVTDNAGFTNTCSGSVIYTHDRYTRTQHYCDRKAASYTCSYCCSWKKTCYYSTAATGVSGNIQFTCSGLPSNYDCYSNSPSSCTGKVYDSSGNYVGSTTTRPNLNYGGCTGCSGNYCSSTCYEYYQSYCSSSNGRSVYSTNWSYYMNDNYSSSNVDYSCSSTSSFTCNSGKYKSSYYTCSSPWKVCDSGYTKLNETYCYSN